MSAINVISINEINKYKSIRSMNESNLSGRGKFFYPSVDCGPINNSKAKSLLGFQPSKIENAITKTVDFFSTADKYSVEYKKVTAKVSKAFKIK